jgi:23S rRNA pseudouridine2605 synthase
MQRLSKVLAERGIASRRGAEKIIEMGRVKVNGKEVLLPQFMVDGKKDLILLDNTPIPVIEKKVYFILNKPKGYLCTNGKEINKKKVIDIFQDLKMRVFTVGRLDKDTTGLLIITNDGYFANKVIHPSSNLEKEYLVKVEGEILEEDLISISKGVEIDKKWVYPSFVKKIRKGSLKIGVKEGKKHEVKLLVQNCGQKVKELKRIRIGPFVLGTLPEGAYRKMTKKEISQFLPNNNDCD